MSKRKTSTNSNRNHYEQTANWQPGGLCCYWRDPDGRPKQTYSARTVAYLDGLVIGWASEKHVDQIVGKRRVTA